MYEEETMKVRSLGHMVIKVHDQHRAKAFYHGLLGFLIAGRSAEMSATLFTLRHHHDFAMVAVGDDAKEAPTKLPGLLHVAFMVGELREAKMTRERSGFPVKAYDHGVSKSLYFNDPDRNCIEFYVDVTDAWKQNPQLIAHSEPL